MSEENKEEQKRGERGEVGTGNPSTRLKARWRKEGKGQSLKEFVASLVKSDPEAQKWFDAKAGKFEASRSDKNIARIQVEKLASKSAKRK